MTAARKPSNEVDAQLAELDSEWGGETEARSETRSEISSVAPVTAEPRTDDESWAEQFFEAGERGTYEGGAVQVLQQAQAELEESRPRARTPEQERRRALMVRRVGAVLGVAALIGVLAIAKRGLEPAEASSVPAPIAQRAAAVTVTAPTPTPSTNSPTPSASTNAAQTAIAVPVEAASASPEPAAAASQSAAAARPTRVPKAPAQAHTAHKASVARASTVVAPSRPAVTAPQPAPTSRGPSAAAFPAP